MSLQNLSFWWLGVGLLVLGSCAPRPKADLVVQGGVIYTVDEALPTAEAVAVRAGRVVFVGSQADVTRWIGPGTRVIDLNGRVLTPGFIEGHGHLMGLGYNELNLDLLTIRSYDELIARVQEAVAKARPGQWIEGRGWHQDKWDSLPHKMVDGFPTHEALSAVSPDNPVLLRHASGHAALANARAMQLAGVNQLSIESLAQDLGEGGEIIRDVHGNPTGVFNERAQTLIARHIPSYSETSDAEALDLALAACAREGITGFHDAGASRENIALYRRFQQEGKLTTRLYVMITGWDPELIYEYFRSGPVIDPQHELTIRAIKLNCDGALGSRGAWLLEPYSDRPETSGMPTYPMDSVLRMARQGLRYGFQICAHAIGDRANREILDRFEVAFREQPALTDHRFRIEHAQHLHPADIPRFAALGVLPAMQAIHLSSDRPWAIERLGEQRIREGAYRWQTLLRTGTRVINGTDVPVEPLNPIASFYASVTRKTLAGLPDGGYEPAEKMTREQALRSYTLDAAYGAFEEQRKGSVTVGKLADFVVWSADLMAVPDEQLLGIRAEVTIVGGKVVFEKP